MQGITPGTVSAVGIYTAVRNINQLTGRNKV